MESAVDGDFEKLDSSHYKQSVKVIEHRLEQCVEVNEDFIEEERYQIFYVLCIRLSNMLREIN